MQHPQYNYFSSGSRNFGEGGPRNMKYKPPCMAAIFFWPIFTGQGGGHGPLAQPPTPGLDRVLKVNVTVNFLR